MSVESSETDNWKLTRIFNVRIAPCGKSVNDARKELNMIGGLGFNQDIFRTSARLGREGEIEL